MGHRKRHAPKRGSLAFSPRKRAARITGRIRSWPENYDLVGILGFAGYKAGMVHAIVVEDKPTSPYFEQEIAVAATVLDCPPLKPCAIRAYSLSPYGFKTLGEAWYIEKDADLKKVFPTSKDYDTEAALDSLTANMNKIDHFRMLFYTQPWLAGGVPKKKPDIVEIKISMEDIQAQFEFASSLLEKGKEARVSEVLKEGQYVDTIAVTKGKGFQGPVKRWGIRILQHKSRKTKRGVGAIGAWHPARVMYTVPRAGQMGFHNRTDYNKRILKTGENGKEITPKGGFTKYGIVRGDYVILKGSVPGTRKRLVRLRYSLRPSPIYSDTPPTISFISSFQKTE